MDSRQRVQETHRVVRARWHPAERRIYKLKQNPPLNGTCLKINLRLNPTWSDLPQEGEELAEYVKEYTGGLFLQIVPQGEHNKRGFPTADHESERRVTAKLGMPDASALVVAREQVRLRGLEVPEQFRHAKQPKPDTVGLYHKTPNGGGVAIAWQFSDEGSYVRLSRAKDHAQSIKLTLAEEYQVIRYLERAIDAMFEAGY